MALDKAFSEILSKRTSHRMSNLCSYQVLYNSLSEQDQKTLDEAWEKQYPTNLIVQALRADGHKCSTDTIRTHKKGTCRCPKA